MQCMHVLRTEQGLLRLGQGMAIEGEIGTALV
jgi:hypothetical protein